MGNGPPKLREGKDYYRHIFGAGKQYFQDLFKEPLDSNVEYPNVILFQRWISEDINLYFEAEITKKEPKSVLNLFQKSKSSRPNMDCRALFRIP